MNKQAKKFLHEMQRRHEITQICRRFGLGTMEAAILVCIGSGAANHATTIGGLFYGGSVNPAGSLVVPMRGLRGRELIADGVLPHDRRKKGLVLTDAGRTLYGDLLKDL